jgi:hypothetical protein
MSSVLPDRPDDATLRRDHTFLVSFGGRLVGLVVLLYFTWCILARGLTYQRWPGSAILGIVDGANFFFHEGGHFIFMVFGEFMTILGGSLNQVLIPAICTAQFFRQRQYAAAAIGLFWTGESLTGVAMYAADAQARRLPLHGAMEGDTSMHDWFNLLTRMGLLERADLVGGLFFTLAIALMLAALGMLALECLSMWQRPARAQELPEA